ncbi:NAD(P)H-dependent oxidoreductase [Prochlorococcus sp. MIT 0603]
MASTKSLLIITASDGENLKLAKQFAAIGKEIVKNPEIIDLTTLDIPIFTPKTQNNSCIPSDIDKLNSHMLSKSHWVVCAPEYNGSIPPVLTNAIAWLSVQDKDFRKLFNGRPIAMASFSGGGCMELLISMRIQLTHLGAQVVGRQLASNKSNPAKDESIKDILQRLLAMNPLNI